MPPASAKSMIASFASMQNGRRFGALLNLKRSLLAIHKH
jgi:hypothetical protein